MAQNNIWVNVCSPQKPTYSDQEHKQSKFSYVTSDGDCKRTLNASGSIKTYE